MLWTCVSNTHHLRFSARATKCVGQIFRMYGVTRRTFRALMKRDMDLIRLIMIEIEKNPEPMLPIQIELSGHSSKEISYHIMLLAEHGFVKAIDFSSSDGLEW